MNYLKTNITLLLKLIILLLFVNQYSFAQDFITVSGKVIDSKTKKAVFLANISICENPIGVTTNDKGEFTFKIPEKFKNDNLCISCVGYISIKNNLTKFKNEDKIYEFYLKPNIIDINEVEVLSKRKRIEPEEIVRKAISLISVNYPQKPFLLSGYYRDYLKSKTQYINLLEVALELEDYGFNVPDFENTKIKVLQTRFNSQYDYDKSKNISYDNSLTKYIPGVRLTTFGGNEFSILRAHDPIRNSNRFSFSFADVFEKDFVEKHFFVLDSVTYSDNQYVYCINFEYKNKVTESANYSSLGSGFYHNKREEKQQNIKGTIYISADNFSIKKIIYTNFFNDNKHNGKIYEFIAEYKEFENKMYLNYLSFSNYFEIQDFSKPNYFELDSAIYNRNIEKLELHFNNKIDLESSLKSRNFKVKFEDKKIKNNNISLKKSNVILLDFENFSVPSYYKSTDDKFSVNVKRIFDVNGNEIGKLNTISMYQFREFFVNEIKTDNFTNILSKDAILKTTPLFYFKNDKDPKFWDSYNFTMNKSFLK